MSFYFLFLKCHLFLSNSSATPPGAPQRVSGKVFGTVNVGSTTVELNNIDLHAYIVVGDGRAYTAISEVGVLTVNCLIWYLCFSSHPYFLCKCFSIGQVPEPAGWALMPVAPIGELFGWLFALELPNSQAGFKITGKIVCVFKYVALYILTVEHICEEMRNPLFHSCVCLCM